MSMKLRVAAGLALVGIFLLSGLFPTLAGDPTDEVRVAIDKEYQIINGSNLRSKDEKEERIGRLLGIVYPQFDFKTMARRSLGLHWRERTLEEQQEFVTLFTDLLEMSYANKVDLYKGRRVVFTREMVDKDYARVDSKVINKDGEELSINYKLLRKDGNWKIYDIVVENISLINNYRSQFNRIITGSSYGGLIKRMKQSRWMGWLQQ